MASDIRIRMNGREQSFGSGREIRIGRDPSRNDLLSENPLVSRYHARLHPTAAGWTVQDMGSTHGTYADGQRIGEMRVEGSLTLWLGPPGRGELVQVEAAGGGEPARWAVFISYRRSDCAGYAALLHTELEKHFGTGHVFRDLNTLMPGTNYVNRIQNAIGSCAVVIALIGREWAGRLPNGGRRIDDPNDLLRQEITAALQLGVRVIPVLVQDGTLPSAEQLPEPLRPLAQRHALHIDDAGVNHQVPQLISAVEQTVGRPMSTPEQHHHQPPPPPPQPGPAPAPGPAPVAVATRPVSPAWWLGPVLFGLLGGIIAWAVVRERDRSLATWMLVAGLAQSVVLCLGFYGGGI